MEDGKPSSESRPTSLEEIRFAAVPADQGPAPRPPREVDPRIVADHFAPLLPDPPSAEERWQEKRAGSPFPGL